MKALLVDNYDSFTYNLFQLWAMVSGHEPQVVRNDDWATWNALDAGRFDALLISPGPGRADRATDLGISQEALTTRIPLLGVCLGHQALCVAEGASLTHAPEPMHGRTSPIIHDGTGLFRGLPQRFLAARYHSLIVTGLPPSLAVTATTPGPAGTADVVMAARHRSRPQWGVQFHPESIATQHGAQLLRNFCDLATADRGITAGTRTAPPAAEARPQRMPVAGPSSTLRLLSRRVPVHADGADLFERLFAGQSHRYWLDGSGGPASTSSLSILGGLGPLGEWVTARAGSGTVTVEAGGTSAKVAGDILGHLGSQLEARRIAAPELPFDFALGYVGFLGYELKADTGGDAAHISDLPDAGLLFSDRAAVIDHGTGQTWLLALADEGTHTEAVHWLEHAAAQAEASAAAAPGPAGPGSPATGFTGGPAVPVRYRFSPAQYEELVRQCQAEIREGESYEICLTNMLTVDGAADPARLFSAVRSISPAPHAALLTFPGASVVSASPERFLRISPDGRIQARPIKGTRRRGATGAEDVLLAKDLETSEKDRAENLMIVDLLRNDLGRVAETGSVEVTSLFGVETFAPVHQLVSTIEAQLRPGLRPVDCVRAAFPGGSMTGAPKRRTMQIIDRLEGAARGVYSGALGYFSLTGAVDLSIVIRTLVVHPDRVTLGVGGAVVAQSVPRAETEEMLLKAQAPLQALARALNP